MEATSVLVKTAKGAEEVKSRAHGLAARLRSVLIMVDGNTTVEQFLARFSAIPDVAGSLEALVQQGFVAAAAPAAAGTSVGPPVGGAAPAPSSRKEAVAQLCQMILASMGPEADRFTLLIEKAGTRADFEAAAERCARVLEGVGGRGRKLAPEFRDLAARVAQQFFTV